MKRTIYNSNIAKTRDADRARYISTRADSKDVLPHEQYKTRCAKKRDAWTNENCKEKTSKEPRLLAG
jgi:hypothetical protein